MALISRACISAPPCHGPDAAYVGPTAVIKAVRLNKMDVKNFIMDILSQIAVYLSDGKLRDKSDKIMAKVHPHEWKGQFAASFGLSRYIWSKVKIRSTIIK